MPSRGNGFQGKFSHQKRSKNGLLNMMKKKEKRQPEMLSFSSLAPWFGSWFGCGVVDTTTDSDDKTYHRKSIRSKSRGKGRQRRSRSRSSRSIRELKVGSSKKHESRHESNTRDHSPAKRIGQAFQCGEMDIDTLNIVAKHLQCANVKYYSGEEGKFDDSLYSSGSESSADYSWNSPPVVDLNKYKVYRGTVRRSDPHYLS